MCRGGCANLIKGASFLMQILPAGVLFNFVEKQQMYLESIAGESFEEQIKRRKKKRSKCHVITRIKDRKEKKREKNQEASIRGVIRLISE